MRGATSIAGAQGGTLQPEFPRGDWNEDDLADISDAVGILRVLFLGVDESV